MVSSPCSITEYVKKYLKQDFRASIGEFNGIDRWTAFIFPRALGARAQAAEEEAKSDGAGYTKVTASPDQNG